MTRRVLLVFGLVSVLLLGVINLVYAQDSGPQNMAGPQSVDAPEAVLGTAFTYQGQLKSGGTAISGSCEMAFRLYDAASAGNPIGSPITQTVTVNAGLFTTQLDFGASAFNGQGRWLETAVKCGGDVAFTTLSRQALTAVPYALYARSVDTLTVQSRVSGACGAGFAVRQVNADGTVVCEAVTGGGAHDHWGASWTGAETGLTLTSTNKIGLVGATTSSNSYGVGGLNMSGSGAGSGVWGQSASTDGRGVTGSNTAASGQNYGVYGESTSTGGRGVAGYATATTGSAYGVSGQSDSTDGRGVYGNASAAAGSAYGVYGRSVSINGAGVYGTAAATTGSTYGVYAVSASTSGRGLYADAAATTGNTYGVYGHVASPDGWAGYFNTVAGNGVYINAPSGTGLNVVNGAALVAGNTIWHAGNDGPTSGLNADLLEGQHGSYYQDASHIQTGTLGTAYYSAYSDLNAEGYLGNASGDLALNNGILNTNLNADLLDGMHSQDFWHAGNDGHASGLNADLLDGQHGSYYLTASNIQAGTLGTGYYSAYSDLSAEGYLDNNASTDLLTRAQSDGRYWLLGGNSVTADTALGTTSNYALNLVVNNTRILRLEPNAISPNVIGGYSGNSVTAGVYGATIGGGGTSFYPNQVSGDYATIGGGGDNMASGSNATVGGGFSNTAGGSNATVGGGYSNAASDLDATIGGGQRNVANGSGATVSGGYSNTVSNSYATIGGGFSNTTSGNTATIGGGGGNTASGSSATVGGGGGNTAIANYATIPGGSEAVADHYGQWAYASGGFNNNAGTAQSSLYVVRYTTNSVANAHVLLLDGNTQLLIIPSDRTLTFDILVVGRTLAGESAGYKIQGVIENVGGTTAFIGTPTTTVLGEDDAAWTVGVVTDSNDTLGVYVQGNNETIHWVATVHTAEVGW